MSSQEVRMLQGVLTKLISEPCKTPDAQEGKIIDEDSAFDDDKLNSN